MARKRKDKTKGDHSSTVGAYMTRTVVSVDSGTPLTEVCQKMIGQSISCVIVARKGKPLGLISERSVVRRLATGKSLGVTARKAMSSPLLTCSPKTSLVRALEEDFGSETAT